MERTLPEKSALVIQNPVSGGAAPEQVEAALRIALGARGVGVETFVTPQTESVDELREAIQNEIAEAVAGGADLIIVAGGDGTVGMVADAIVQSGVAEDAVLGIIPLGTANILARELRIPLDVDGAVALLRDGWAVRSLDAIRVEGRHYFTQLGVGLDARMIMATDREDQIAHGRAAYMAALAQSLAEHHVTRFSCQVDEMGLQLRAFQVIVANCATLGAAPFTWGPGILPDDGVLNVCVFNTRSALDTAKVVWKVLTSDHSRGALTRYYPATERIVIRSRPPLDVQADGEIIGRTPVTIDLAPGVLKVVAPLPPVTNQVLVAPTSFEVASAQGGGS